MPYMLLILVFIFSILNISEVKAEASLFFAPTRVDLSDKEAVQEIRVTNMSSIGRSYNISIENLIMTEDGKTSRVDNFDYSAKRMLRFVPRRFELQPGERQIVRIMARFPEGTDDGEYHAHLEFLENVSRRIELNKDLANTPENRALVNAQISYATAIPVVISKGEINTRVNMEDVRVKQDDKGKRFIELSLLRSGNGQGKAYVEADYIAVGGQEKKAAVRRTVYVYREINKRNHSFLLELLEPADFVPGAKVRVKLYDRNVSESEPSEVIEIPVI